MYAATEKPEVKISMLEASINNITGGHLHRYQTNKSSYSLVIWAVHEDVARPRLSKQCSGPAREERVCKPEYPDVNTDVQVLEELLEYVQD